MRCSHPGSPRYQSDSWPENQALMLHRRLLQRAPFPTKLGAGAAGATLRLVIPAVSADKHPESTVSKEASRRRPWKTMTGHNTAKPRSSISSRLRIWSANQPRLVGNLIASIEKKGRRQHFRVQMPKLRPRPSKDAQQTKAPSKQHQAAEKNLGQYRSTRGITTDNQER